MSFDQSERDQSKAIAMQGWKQYFAFLDNFSDQPLRSPPSSFTTAHEKHRQGTIPRRPMRQQQQRLNPESREYYPRNQASSQPSTRLNGKAQPFYPWTPYRDPHAEYHPGPWTDISEEVEQDMEEIANAMYGDEMEPQVAGPIHAEVNDDMDEIENALYGDQYEPEPAGMLDAEIEAEMREIENELYGNGMEPAGDIEEELERDMEEILAEIEGSHTGPQYSMPVDEHLYREMQEVDEYIRRADKKRKSNGRDPMFYSTNHFLYS